MSERKIRELEEENEDLHKRLEEAYCMLGMRPQSMSLDQLINWQSARLSKKGYLWWAAKMGMGAAGYVAVLLALFALISLITGSSSIICNMN